VYDGGLVILHGGLSFVHVRGWDGGRAMPFGVQGQSCDDLEPSA
jgi:hypothetical protein